MVLLYVCVCLNWGEESEQKIHEFRLKSFADRASLWLLPMLNVDDDIASGLGD